MKHPVQFDQHSGFLVFTSELTGAKRRFRLIQGAAAWGDPRASDPKHRDHAVIVGGVQEDKRINIFQEAVGTWKEIVSAAIRFKDRYLVSDYFVPRQPDYLFRSLNNTEAADGLTGYRILGRGPFGPIYAVSDPAREWDHFRDWTTRALILPVPEIVEAQLDAAYTRCATLVHDESVLLDRTACPELERALGRKMKDAVNFAVFRAFIHLVATMDMNLHHKDNSHPPWVKTLPSPEQEGTWPINWKNTF